MEGSLDKITSVGILAEPDEGKYSNLIANPVISISVAGSKNIDLIQGDQR